MRISCEHLGDWPAGLVETQHGFSDTQSISDLITNTMRRSAYLGYENFAAVDPGYIPFINRAWTYNCLQRDYTRICQGCGGNRMSICQQSCNDGLIDRFEFPSAGNGTGKIDVHFLEFDRSASRSDWGLLSGSCWESSQVLRKLSISMLK